MDAKNFLGFEISNIIGTVFESKIFLHSFLTILCGKEWTFLGYAGWDDGLFCVQFSPHKTSLRADKLASFAISPSLISPLWIIIP